MFKNLISKYGVFFSLLPLTLFLIIVSDYHLMAWILPGYSSYDIQRILELVLFAMTALILIFVPSQRRLWLGAYDQIKPWIRLGWLIFLLLGLVSSVLASVPRYAFLQVSVYFFMFVFALFITAQRIVYQDRLDRVLLLIIGVSMAVYELTFIQMYITALRWHIAYNVSPGYVNMRFLADVLSWTLPLTALPFFMETVKRSWLLKCLFFMMGSLWWMIFFVNQSKGLLLVLVFVMLFLAVYYRSRIIPIMKYLLVLALSGYLLWFVFFKWGLGGLAIEPLMVHFSVSAAEGTFASRLTMWLWALTKIKMYPWLGLGPMHHYFVSPAFDGQFVGNPHNSILEIAVSWGIPAVLMLLMMVFYGYFRWIKSTKLKVNTMSFDTVLPMVLVFSLLSSALDSLGCALIMTPVSQVFMVVIVGWTFGYFVSTRDILPKTFSPITNSFFMLLLFLFLIMMWIGIYPEVLFLPGLEIKWYFLHGFKEAFTPGFWQQGIFTMNGLRL